MAESSANKNFPDLLASVSRLAIAAAIVYFAYQMAQIGVQVGGVTQTVDRVTEQVPPALVEVREIRLEVAAVREQIPAILGEVSAVSEQIPAILSEVAALRAQLPAVLARTESLERQIGPILQRVDNTLAVVQETQRQLPQILETSNQAIAALNQTRDQVVPLVPKALDEVRLTRESVDPTLDRVEVIIDDAFFKADRAIASASEAGRQASEGAVKGFFTGLVKLPFALVGTLASPLIATMDPKVAELLTEDDMKLMNEAGGRATQVEYLNREQTWENPDSGNSGSVTILRKFEIDKHQCVEARITISTDRRQVHDRTNEFCLGADGSWKLAAEIG